MPFRLYNELTDLRLTLKNNLSIIFQKNFQKKNIIHYSRNVKIHRF